MDYPSEPLRIYPYSVNEYVPKHPKNKDLESDLLPIIQQIHDIYILPETRNTHQVKKTWFLCSWDC